MQETRLWSLGREDSLEKEMTTHASTLAWKSHGQRSLAGYSPWSHRRVRHDLAINNNKTLVIPYTPKGGDGSTHRPPSAPTSTHTHSLHRQFKAFLDPGKSGIQSWKYKESSPTWHQRDPGKFSPSSKFWHHWTSMRATVLPTLVSA